MPNRKDFFISYGRKESKAFATKLYHALEAQGYSGWFDMVNIPSGNDYIKQIEFGIKSAHNFIFILSPHANRSQHCRDEIALAVQYGKRIVPLLHVEDREGSAPPPIQRIQWINARQKPSALPLEQWEDVDDFSTALETVTTLFEKDSDYVNFHTQLLLKALQWEEVHYPTALLLEGEERLAAQTWLLREFPPPQQAPCFPTALISEYICESKKNAENMLTDVFLNYHGDDNQVYEKLRSFLNSRLISSWNHLRDIQKGGDAKRAQLAAIEHTTHFLFPITPASGKDPNALMRLEYADSLNKKIIPLLLEATPEQLLPPQIKGLQPIDFTDNQQQQDLQADLGELLKEIKNNEPYHRQHRNFLVQALKWQRNGCKPSMLLRGHQVSRATDFLKLGKMQARQPLPIHHTFTQESAEQQEHQYPEVFIAYSRKDSDFARRVNEALQMSGKVTWFDQESIFAGSDNFEAAITEGIGESDNFLFIVSEHSVGSPYCQRELELAQESGKRIFTLMLSYPQTAMPQPLDKINWIEFRNRDFDMALTELLKALDTDREHVRQHNRWQNKAKEWLENEKEADRLLRGSELGFADAWLIEALKVQKYPQPTELQQQFIQESLNAQEREQRKKAKTITRLRWSLGISIVGLLAAVGFAIWAFTLKSKADEQRKRSELLRDFAEKQSQKAQESEQEALEMQKALNILNAKYAALLELAEQGNPAPNASGATQQLVQEIQVMQEQIDEVNLEVTPEEGNTGTNEKEEAIAAAPPPTEKEDLAAPKPAERPMALERQEQAVEEQERTIEALRKQKGFVERRPIFKKAIEVGPDSLFIIAIRGRVLDKNGKELKRGTTIPASTELNFASDDARLSVVNDKGNFIINKKGRFKAEGE